MIAFIDSVRSEWLKRRRSAASWLVVVGAFFVPSIVLLIRLRRPEALLSLYQANAFWERLYDQVWRTMAIMVLPLGIVLATSLIAQLEFRSHGWKQLFATPQRPVTIYLAKLTVVLVMLVQVFLLFNLGAWLVAFLPTILVRGIEYPEAAFPVALTMHRSLDFLIDCLPSVGIQFALGVLFRNFMVPMGFGVAAWIAAIWAMSWKYAYIFPHGYPALDHVIATGQRGSATLPIDLQVLALAVFGAVVLLGYVAFVRQSDKG